MNRSPTRDDFRFFDTLRVRWAEVDMQKIVFNGHYLMYADTAVAGYWRAMAMPYHETLEGLHGDLYVRKATLEYEGSARYDERIDVGVRTGRIGNSSMALAVGMFRGERVLVHGELLYVFADPATQTSRPVPQPLREALTAFEAGEPMVRVEVGGWAGQQAEATALRHAVFAHEQGIDAALMTDAADAHARHALARNRFGLAVAAGRLLQPEPGVGQIGRMTTHAGVRSAGVGRQVLDALVGASKARGDHAVVLHAQMAAVSFYRRAGFAAEGPVYEEAGVAHQTMRLRW
jgi:YbgC/YbaW family acyl-CoA thioester hydrolase